MSRILNKRVTKRPRRAWFLPDFSCFDFKVQLRGQGPQAEGHDTKGYQDADQVEVENELHVYFSFDFKSLPGSVWIASYKFVMF